MQSTHFYIEHMFFDQSDVLFSGDKTLYLVEYVKGDVTTSFKVHLPSKLTPLGALKKQVVMNTVGTNKLILPITEDSWQSSYSKPLMRTQTQSNEQRASAKLLVPVP